MRLVSPAGASSASPPTPPTTLPPSPPLLDPPSFVTFLTAALPPLRPHRAPPTPSGGTPTPTPATPPTATMSNGAFTDMEASAEMRALFAQLPPDHAEARQPGHWFHAHVLPGLLLAVVPPPGSLEGELATTPCAATEAANKYGRGNTFEGDSALHGNSGSDSLDEGAAYEAVLQENKWWSAVVAASDAEAARRQQQALSASAPNSFAIGAGKSGTGSDIKADHDLADVERLRWLAAGWQYAKPVISASSAHGMRATTSALALLIAILRDYPGLVLLAPPAPIPPASQQARASAPAKGPASRPTTQQATAATSPGASTATTSTTPLSSTASRTDELAHDEADPSSLLPRGALFLRGPLAAFTAAISVAPAARALLEMISGFISPTAGPAVSHPLPSDRTIPADGQSIPGTPATSVSIQPLDTVQPCQSLGLLEQAPPAFWEAWAEAWDPPSGIVGGSHGGDDKASAEGTNRIMELLHRPFALHWPYLRLLTQTAPNTVPVPKARLGACLSGVERFRPPFEMPRFASLYAPPTQAIPGKANSPAGLDGLPESLASAWHLCYPKPEHAATFCIPAATTMEPLRAGSDTLNRSPGSAATTVDEGGWWLSWWTAGSSAPVQTAPALASSLSPFHAGDGPPACEAMAHLLGDCFARWVCTLIVAQAAISEYADTTTALRSRLEVLLCDCAVFAMFYSHPHAALWAACVRAIHAMPSPARSCQGVICDLSRLQGGAVECTAREVPATTDVSVGVPEPPHPSPDEPSLALRVRKHLRETMSEGNSASDNEAAKPERRVRPRGSLGCLLVFLREACNQVARAFWDEVSVTIRWLRNRVFWDSPEQRCGSPLSFCCQAALSATTCPRCGGGVCTGVAGPPVQ